MKVNKFVTKSKRLPNIPAYMRAKEASDKYWADRLAALTPEHLAHIQELIKQDDKLLQELC